MARRRENLPGGSAQSHQSSRLKRMVKCELGTELASGQIGKRCRVPLRNLARMAWGNPGLQVWIPGLQGRISSAMIAVKMGVDENIKWAISQNAIKQ